MSQDFNTFMSDVLTMVFTIVDIRFVAGLMGVTFALSLVFRLMRLAIPLFFPPEPEPKPRPRYSPIIVPYYAKRRDPNHPIRD